MSFYLYIHASALSECFLLLDRYKMIISANQKSQIHEDHERNMVIPQMRHYFSRGGSKTAATSKVELFVIIVNGSRPLTINTTNSNLDVAAVLDPSLLFLFHGFIQKYRWYLSKYCYYIMVRFLCTWNENLK